MITRAPSPLDHLTNTRDALRHAFDALRYAKRALLAIDKRAPDIESLQALIDEANERVLAAGIDCARVRDERLSKAHAHNKVKRGGKQ